LPSEIELVLEEEDNQRKAQKLNRMHNAKTPNGPAKRKEEIKLADYGVTFDRYKAELERGISLG